MFSTISWLEYAATVALLLIVYYLTVAVKFYSYELQSLFRRKDVETTSTSGNTDDKVKESNKNVRDNDYELFPTYQRYAQQPDEIDDTFEKVEQLTTKLREVITGAASVEQSKEALTKSLQSLLKNYHFLKGSAFVVAVNNLIASECEKQHLNYLSADDLVMLWN